MLLTSGKDLHKAKATLIRLLSYLLQRQQRFILRDQVSREMYNKGFSFQATAGHDTGQAKCENSSLYISAQVYLQKMSFTFLNQKQMKLVSLQKTNKIQIETFKYLSLKIFLYIPTAKNKSQMHMESIYILHAFLQKCCTNSFPELPPFHAFH